MFQTTYQMIFGHFPWTRSKRACPPSPKDSGMVPGRQKWEARNPMKAINILLVVWNIVNIG